MTLLHQANEGAGNSPGNQFESFVDGRGQTVIDLTGGFGYQVPEVIEPVLAQTRSMGLSNRVLMSEPLIRLCRRLADMLPKPLANSYVCNSGDEAFEGALKLCKGLAPRRRTLVYVKGCDFGALSYGRCLNQPAANQELLRFLGLRLKAVEHEGDLQGIDWGDCFAVCHAYVRLDTRRNGQGQLRLVEPALVDALREAAARADVPVIGMDVQSGLGSLGTMFGHERLGRAPDIVVLGGALGGGAIPIGTYTCSEQLAYRVYGRSTPAKHGSTTAGNPMACVAALAALEHAHASRAPERCLRNGRILADALAAHGARPVGAWVALPVPAGLDAAALRRQLHARGVHIAPPEGAEFILRCPITARPIMISRAATTIQEALSHVYIDAA